MVRVMMVEIENTCFEIATSSFSDIIPWQVRADRENGECNR